MNQREDDGDHHFSWSTHLRSALKHIDLLAEQATPLVVGWRWLFSASLIGGLPLVLAWTVALDVHRIVSSVGLSFICLGLARQGRWICGPSAITLVFVIHSLLAIALTSLRPDQTQLIMPEGREYWDRQHEWIQSGRDDEYQLESWLPEHCILFIGTTVFTVSSFGILTFMKGFQQVDMMNFYSGTFATMSPDSPSAALAAWHTWSLLRGVGYVILTYELIQFTYRFCAGNDVKKDLWPIARCMVGIGFLLLDGIVKYAYSETTRTQLHEMLSS